MSQPRDLRDRADALRQRFPERRQATPPAENGQRLACVQRGPDEELRIAWASYEGRPFLSLRLWTRDKQGGWWPDPKRGIAVRLRELADVAGAIAEALDLADEHLARRGRPPARGAAPASRPERSGLEGRQAHGGAAGGFDEFEGE